MEKVGERIMQIYTWFMQMLVSFVVLYSIGYYVAGFSALTIQWLLFLAVLIATGIYLVNRIFNLQKKGKFINRAGINFVVAAVAIFGATQMIYGGGVPFLEALLAAAIIALLAAAFTRPKLVN